MEMKNNYPIGVFDSGVGGLTVLKQLQKLLPNESFVYLGDTKNNPYGPRTAENICELSQNIIDHLASVPVKMAVIACNTITVVAGDKLRQKTDMPIVGNSYGVNTALKLTKTNKIGVMATMATIGTHKHKNALEEANEAITAFEEPCPTLAGDIEEGIEYHPELKETLTGHLDNLLANDVDTIILGCTHYPFVENMLKEIVAEKYPSKVVNFVDPGLETAMNTKQALVDNSLLADENSVQVMDINFTKVLATTKVMVANALANQENEIKEIQI